MPISQDTVAHIALLARLEIDAPTQERFTRQFGDILQYMDILGSVDTTGVDPLYSPVHHDNALREDIAAKLRSREEVLSNAPEQDGQFFVVPRIV